MEHILRLNPIMTRCLTKRQQEADLQIAMAGDMTFLVRKDEILKSWAPGELVTVFEAQEAADRVLEADMHLFDFERLREVLDNLKEEYAKSKGE